MASGQGINSNVITQSRQRRALQSLHAQARRAGRTVRGHASNPVTPMQIVRMTRGLNRVSTKGSMQHVNNPYDRVRARTSVEALRRST